MYGVDKKIVDDVDKIVDNKPNLPHERLDSFD